MQENTMTYNTSRNQMVIPEYGRNIQNMIKFCKTIEDKEERNKCANAIIKVMGQLNPHLRDIEDFNHKLWAHLFVMSNFELDVDSPYPIPSQENFTSKPRTVDYPQGEIKYGHYGKIAQEWISAATKLEDGEERNHLIGRLLNMLKSSYLIWHKDSVDDQVINELVVKQLHQMSNQKLTGNTDMLLSAHDLLKGFKRSKNNNNNSNNRKYKRKKR